MTRRPFLLAAVVALAAPLAACDSQPPKDLKGESAQIQHGQHLFARNCAMCHSLDAAGAQGSATKIRDRERPDGPNFNVRKETRDSVLYAIRNGGFSGAIMPENIVVGADAEAVAAFLSKYAGGGPVEKGGNPASSSNLTGQVRSGG